ncbi:hypothetical protein NEPAR06_0079 [Nematocida parisii]|uniref:Uncharacterized protein n=1 Tax=Nematocida parisii (strain ERTm3) TaxID=935791 RepID=I3EE50_NEMP3|nr:uncharacterized protein NEPG_00099 [Nematocida parisii ERTm1]EIJ87497.1 hypothetical protein NEQG_02378 [Nematocida parisii ERTm3]KAI5127055.1 hypothetical protein NEPAR08_0727 [Nematocida parisii]EIJ94577.1 hypothetical protein NEPG_00099 [Nematocida parisii ERTm1]KAI5131408.1 hypothetical protein NEPAR03_2423 [Nematocida parisii]KAI5141155.1 hypothetical protein NEPAR04_0726 [Nematocida parisii]|eukprot:XP_013057933.1 hypothetical protein NEPG_00099 [Nematocida parisii ERTm1]
MARENKTGRRWSFMAMLLGLNQSVTKNLKIDPRIRYATWYIIKNRILIIKGYLELKTPIKQTGVHKILGIDLPVILKREKRCREEIIKEIEDTPCVYNLYEVGERKINKGGRPRKKELLTNPIDINNFLLIKHKEFFKLDL